MSCLYIESELDYDKVDNWKLYAWNIKTCIKTNTASLVCKKYMIESYWQLSRHVTYILIPVHKGHWKKGQKATWIQTFTQTDMDIGPYMCLHTLLICFVDFFETCRRDQAREHAIREVIRFTRKWITLKGQNGFQKFLPCIKTKIADDHVLFIKFNGSLMRLTRYLCNIIHFFQWRIC